ncbi:MAG: hypothetical protein ACLFNQ_09630 [Spirochaetaceae bacterium]
MLRRVMCLQLILLTGCSLVSGTRIIDLHLPDLPASWAGMEADLEYVVTLNGEEERVSAPGATIPVAVPAAEPSVVLVHPRLRGGGAVFRPGGAVVLYEEASVYSSWEDGPLAHIVQAVAATGYPIERINLERLQAEILDRAGRRAWSISIPHVVSALVREEMRVYDVNPHDGYDVRIAPAETLSGYSAWVLSDPLYTEAFSPDETGSFDATLSTGLHHFMTADGVHWIEVYVHDDGSSVSITRRQSSQGGSARQ